MTKIISKISSIELKNFTNIKVSVSHGNVLLAGNIESQKKRLELIKEVWQVEGVQNIYNEMNIGSSLSFSERADNLLFETRLENRLLFESGIYSNNYSIDVVNGNVYVMGTASSIEEKTKLENFLGEMKDIGKLVTIVSLPSKNLNKKNEK
jgi:osmotically-inducible protein OsmY